MDYFLGMYNWYVCFYVRLIYCNVCCEVLFGVMLYGLFCEVCKFKVYKCCVVCVINNCKWIMLVLIGKDIIEDVDGIVMFY